MKQRKVTSENAAHLHREDPHEVSWRYTQHLGEGKWLNLSYRNSDLGIYDMYAALYNGKESWGILSCVQGFWYATVIAGDKATKTQHNSMYDARNTVFDGVWQYLNFRP